MAQGPRHLVSVSAKLENYLFDVDVDVDVHVDVFLLLLPPGTHFPSPFFYILFST